MIVGWRGGAGRGGCAGSAGHAYASSNDHSYHTSCVDGVFTRLGSDHWALLVHGIFNASIERPPDRPEPAVADRLAFIVTSLNVTDGLLGIVGELVE